MEVHTDPMLKKNRFTYGLEGNLCRMGTSAEQGNCTGSWKNVGRLHEVAVLAELLAGARSN